MEKAAVVRIPTDHVLRRARAEQARDVDVDIAPADHHAVLELHDVCRVFDTDPPVWALRHVDVRVDRGEYVAVVGPSGSGKSTLLNVLGLLDRPSSGEYRLDGVDVAQLGDGERAAWRAERLGFIFQSFNLL